MAADYYSDAPGDYGMPDMSNGTGGPTGIPDPNNPGYDTAGYPLQGRTEPPKAMVPPSGNVPINGSPNVTQPPPQPDPPPPGGGLVDAFPSAAPSYINSPSFTPPAFTKPPAFNYADFVLPSGQDVLNEDPSYGFRMNQGEQALQNSAAAGGVLNTGNTLKDILGYGQNFASQEYGNAVNRKLGTYTTNRANAVGNYNTNYQTQYVDPYKFAYQGALDTFAPQMADWSAHNNFDWSSYLQSYDQFRNRQRDSVDAATALS